MLIYSFQQYLNISAIIIIKSANLSKCMLCSECEFELSKEKVRIFILVLIALIVPFSSVRR